jgi:hypothetical protein
MCRASEITDRRDLGERLPRCHHVQDVLFAGRSGFEDPHDAGIHDEHTGAVLALAKHHLLFGILADAGDFGQFPTPQWAHLGKELAVLDDFLGGSAHDTPPTDKRIVDLTYIKAKSRLVLYCMA